MNRRSHDEMKSEGIVFQTSFSPATEEDIRILLQQCRGRKFDARRLLGIARRCRFGKPQVILCNPLLKDLYLRYRYNNPESEIVVDELIAKAFATKTLTLKQ